MSLMARAVARTRLKREICTPYSRGSSLKDPPTDQIVCSADPDESITKHSRQDW